ncbi:globin domain-containing protein [Streptomyces tardus]|nr:globin domain-containing protein [Streptomyces tardus]
MTTMSEDHDIPTRGSSGDEGGWFAASARPSPAGSGAARTAPAAQTTDSGRTRERPLTPTPEPHPADGVEAVPLPPVAVPSAAEIELIQQTLAEIEPVANAVTSHFYSLLFVRNPQLRDLFPAAMDTQRDRLFRALLTTARHAGNPAVLTSYLSGLGRGHRKYGTRAEYYPVLGECLLGALERFAHFTWSPAAETAWVKAYTLISQIMIDAAAVDEQRAPASWQAEVVSHERRSSDTAVITLRTDQPYAFRAGQYTSIETPWWPRVWRHYSFAGAPRSDGLITLHVKAVPAGWVSGALVNRAQPGDVVRLGGPAGTMTVNHRSENGLLCLGGGTGIAPIKAMIEEVAEYGRRRLFDVFYGARSAHELYDLETMRQLEAEHSWLSVHPVVGDGCPVRASVLTGQVPDVIRGSGHWSGHDGYVSGPPGMIRSGIDALRDVGIPQERIRHDALDELAFAGD